MSEQPKQITKLRLEVAREDMPEAFDLVDLLGQPLILSRLEFRPDCVVIELDNNLITGPHRDSGCDMNKLIP